MWGELLSAATSIGGSLLGKKSSDNALSYQKQLNRNQIQWRVEDAKKAGINPLAALGITPMQGGSGYFDTSGFDSAGQAIGRGINSLGRNEKRLAELQIQQENAKLTNMNLENQKLNIEILNMKQSPDKPALNNNQWVQPGLEGQKPVNQDIVEWTIPQKTMSSSMGIEAGTGPLYSHTVGPDGYIRKTYQKDYGDAMESQWFWNHREQAMDIANYGKNLVKGALGPLMSEKSINKIRNSEPYVPDLPEDSELRYDPVVGMWKAVPKDGQNLLFVGDDKWNVPKTKGVKLIKPKYSKNTWNYWKRRAYNMGRR